VHPPTQVLDGSQRLVLVPVADFLFDVAFRAGSSRTRSPGSLEGDTAIAACVGAGAAALLVTALLARLSGCGPSRPGWSAAS
jgi:hypothetical protein